MILSLLLIGGVAHAGGGGSFHGTALDGRMKTGHRIVVIKVTDRYQDSDFYYVNVLDEVTNEQFVMLLRPDQMVKVDGETLVDGELRSNNI